MINQIDIIKIRKPFYSAGHKYGWIGNTVGIGVDMRLLKGDGLIYVKVGDDQKIWEIEKSTAMSVIEKYQSYYSAKGVTLGVIPWHFFSLSKERSA